MSRLVRAEQAGDGCRMFIVAGEHGAVELRESLPGYYTFHVHSPCWREDLAQRALCATGRRGSLPGLVPHGCGILEGECWAGLITCGSYDFDAPDVDTVVQWRALERLYADYLAGGRR